MGWRKDEDEYIKQVLSDYSVDKKKEVDISGTRDIYRQYKLDEYEKENEKLRATLHVKCIWSRDCKNHTTNDTFSIIPQNCCYYEVCKPDDKNICISIDKKC